MRGCGCHTQAFVDDFAAVTVSSDLNDAVNLMQCMLKKVTSWCLKTGLKVNPDKTELVIFTKKHKIPPVAPPSLAGKRLEAKNSAKNLGVIPEMNTCTRRSGSSRRLSGYIGGLWGEGTKTKNGSVALQGRAGAKGRICPGGLVA